MAIPFGRITVLVGAGIVGSVLAKEGRLPYVSEFVSGAYKIARKRISRDDSGASKGKPHNDSLFAQVKSLQEELRMLASNPQMTIVNTGETGGRKYGIIILVALAGYVFVWFKGWKLPDMMVATKSSLNDACSSVAKQLECIYSSISATKRNLSSKIDHVEKSLDESLDATADTQEEVSQLRGRSDTFCSNVKSVYQYFQNLENKVSSFEEKQEKTNQGVKKLCNDARNMENQRAVRRVQAIHSSSSRPALQRPPPSPSPMQNSSLPIGFSVEELSLKSESNGSSNQVQVHPQPLQNTVSDPGLMLEGTSDSNVHRSSILNTTASNGSSKPNGIFTSESTKSKPGHSDSNGMDTSESSKSEAGNSGSNGIDTSETSESEAGNSGSNGIDTSESSKSELGNSGGSGFGLFTRTRSAMSAVFWQSRPSVQS